jgi:protein TonB
LAVSVLVHGALMTWRFADPGSFEQVFENTALAVVLVNARSDHEPENAQALAQVRLAGGGHAAGASMASSPLPPSAPNEEGTDMEAMNRQLDAMKWQQMRLLSQLRQELASLAQETSGEHLQAPERQARQERQQALARQLARIEQQIEKAQAGPQKRFVSTIEARGTLNFPQVGGQKLYGQLTMMISVDPRGRLIKTEVVQSSGQPLLDQRAMAIVQSAAPFEAFSANMRRQALQLVVVSRFQFLKEGHLETQMWVAEPQEP